MLFLCVLVLQQTDFTLFLSEFGKTDVLRAYSFSIYVIAALVASLQVVSKHQLDADVTGEIPAAGCMLPPVVADGWIKRLNMSI